MEKDFIYAELCLTYGGLLTDNQREITEMYYQEDLSLGEISEIKGVTRQCVLDTLAKSRKALSNFEEKLRLYAIKTKLNELLEKDDEIPRDKKREIKEIINS